MIIAYIVSTRNVIRRRATAYLHNFGAREPSVWASIGQGLDIRKFASLSGNDNIIA